MTLKIQAFQEYYIFIAIIYLIIIFLETLGNMEATLPTSHSHLLVLLIFLLAHTIHYIDGFAFTGFGVM
jgi:hypothetical protein